LVGKISYALTSTTMLFFILRTRKSGLFKLVGFQSITLLGQVSVVESYLTQLFSILDLTILYYSRFIPLNTEQNGMNLVLSNLLFSLSTIAMSYEVILSDLFWSLPSVLQSFFPIYPPMMIKSSVSPIPSNKSIFSLTQLSILRPHSYVDASCLRIMPSSLLSIALSNSS